VGSGICTLVRSLAILAILCALLAAPPAKAAHTSASLVLASEMARPGETVMAGIRLRMDHGWHTYWRYPGSSGIATAIKWDLPADVSAGDIQWPVPKKFTEEGITTYIYQGDVVLPVSLKLASNAPPGPIRLKASISWLECNLSCVPGGTDVSATLTVGNDSHPSPDTTLIADWLNKAPAPGDIIDARAWWEKPASGDSRPLIIEWHATAPALEADFFAYGSDDWELQPEVSAVPGQGTAMRITKTIKKLQGNWPDRIAGALIEKPGDRPIAYDVAVPIADSASSASASAIPPANSSSAANSAAPVIRSVSLWKALLFAFLGGLILNVMPCVLPVIALKILGFVNQAGADPREVRRLGLIYAAGVLASFLALAGMVAAVRLAGHAASWGMQFQNQQVFVLLTALVTLISLNLFGVFEVNLGGRVMGAAGNLSAREGRSGVFFNGILAVVLASSCTAPVLGRALIYAYSHRSSDVAVVFLMVGVGLAAPYVVLSWNPALLKFLPKPGVWMERFKVAMGFPMLGTALYFYTAVAPSFGEGGWFWLGMFLVVLAMSAWVWGQFVQRGGSHQQVAASVSIAMLVFGCGYILEGEVHWRTPVSSAAATASTASPDAINWQPWSPEAVQTARQSGRPLLVDFTASWCANCQLDGHVIESAPVRAKLRAINAVTLIENSFSKSATVIAELNKFGRAGVPLVLVYPRDPAAPPEILPEIFRAGTIVAALDRAGAEPPSATANR
jgi:thiol:disulfide interchange protein/DsbC/DsbD-like thiol-disulfide interchange protein